MWPQYVPQSVLSPAAALFCWCRAAVPFVVVFLFCGVSRVHVAWLLILAVRGFAEFRNGLKFKQYLRIHTNTNPARGPFHHRAPSRILFRAVRGMIPHKSERGQQAMGRFKVCVFLQPPNAAGVPSLMGGLLRRLSRVSPPPMTP